MIRSLVSPSGTSDGFSLLRDVILGIDVARRFMRMRTYIAKIWGLVICERC